MEDVISKSESSDWQSQRTYGEKLDFLASAFFLFEWINEINLPSKSLLRNVE